MTARAIVKAMAGDWHGTYGMIRCPSHADVNPSCKVVDDPRKSDGIDVHCFAGCTWQDVKAALRREGLIGDFQPDPHRQKQSRFIDHAPTEPEPDAEAISIWRAAVSIDGTLAETYLRTHRGLAGPFPCSLRYAASVAYRPGGILLPALVAGLARPDRRVVAVQCTYLKADGGKAPVSTPRMTFGKLGTGTIRLATISDVMGLAEGVETALAAMQLTGIPTWAALGGKRLGKITIPADVRHVHVFGDNDVPGHEEAEKAAKRFTREGLHVSVRYPPEGVNDYNDLILHRVFPQPSDRSAA